MVVVELEYGTLRIGNTGRAIFCQFIWFTKKLENIFNKNIQILCKISQWIERFDQSFHMSCDSWVKAKKCQNESCRHPPPPIKKTKIKKTRKWSKLKVTKIILGISTISKFLHVWHLFRSLSQFISSNTATSLPVSPYLNSIYSKFSSVQFSLFSN